MQSAKTRKNVLVLFVTTGAPELIGILKKQTPVIKPSMPLPCAGEPMHVASKPTSLFLPLLKNDSRSHAFLGSRANDLHGRR
jgi:hypothetical protein